MQEYERAVIFRLGRLLSGGSKGPGNWIVSNIVITWHCSLLSISVLSSPLDLDIGLFDFECQTIWSNCNMMDHFKELSQIFIELSGDFELWARVRIQTIYFLPSWSEIVFFSGDAKPLKYLLEFYALEFRYLILITITVFNLSPTIITKLLLY